MSSFYQSYKTPILVTLITIAIIGNGIIASRTWFRNFGISKNFDTIGSELGAFVGLGGEIFAILPDVPQSLETTVLQDAVFLTLETLPVLDTIKPKQVLIDDDPLASFGQVNITNSGIGNNLVITWGSPAYDALSAIKLYRSTSFGSIGSLISEVSSDQRSFKDTNVVTGETYFYSLKGVDENGKEASQLYQYTGKAIDVLAPATPSDVNIEPSASSVRISWSNPSSDDFDFSRVYRSTLPGQLGKLIADNVKSGEYVDTSIIPGITYFYTVTSVDSSLNESSRNTSPSLSKKLSENTGILAKGDILLLITNITAEDVGTGNAITLSWTNPPDTAFDRVRLYRSLTFNEPGVLLVDLPSGQNTYTDSSVTRETVYYYTLRTVDIDGRESDNTIQYVAVARDAVGPSIPENITVSQSLPSVVDISWSRPSESDLAYYRLYRSTDKNTYGHLIADQLTTETFVDSDIEDNKVYYYVVTSVDRAGNESDKPVPAGIIGGRIPFLPFNL